LVQGEDDAESERLLRELFEEKRGEGKLDSIQFHSDSKLGASPLRWAAWRVRGERGAPDYVVALAHESAEARENSENGNDSENREAERRGIHAARLETVGRLAGGVAHDFNNLLTGVLLYCDLLMAVLEPGHRARKYAEEIRKAGMQATGLVRQLLAVARPAECKPRLVCLNDIAEGMRDLLVRLIGENIDLNLKLDSKLGLVNADPAQVQQIVLNLVLNARDAMPNGGQVTIETGNRRLQLLPNPSSSRAAVSLPPVNLSPVNLSPVNLSCALLVVSDNGSGMDAATRAHLFEAFYTTKTAGKGTGLGLATVQDIVRANGGLIHVDSAPGRGTRVTVLLPLVEATASPASFTNVAQSGTQLRQERGGTSNQEREEGLP
jgi:two-component system cell cycle sensor histidine kinase/response regulator CckA